MQPSPGYMGMVAQVKAHYQLPDKQLDLPLKVVIAQRPGDCNSAQRVLTNAAELAASLQERGMQTQVSHSRSSRVSTAASGTSSSTPALCQMGPV